MKHIFTLAISFVISFLVSAGDLPNGKITGKVLDKMNGETLIGVPVMLEGTSLGTVTDLDGKFTIEHVPAGTYNVIFRYIGYTNKYITNVQVQETQPLNLEVVLEQSKQELKEVTVTAEMKKENIGSVLLMQKKSATVQDGISSESIKKTPDKNSGEVIRRISGSSLQEGKFVVIRGLNDRYNNAMLNGFPLSSTEPDRKSFAFDLIPSVLLDNLIVVKTSSPDLPGEFGGGIIQLSTKDIPDKDFLSFTAGTGIHAQSTFKEYKSYEGGKKDWLGIDDGTRALPGEFPASDALKKSNLADKINYSKLLPNDWGIHSNVRSPLSQSYQLSFGKDAKLFKNGFGVIGAITYNNSRVSTPVTRSDFDYDGSQNYSFDDQQYKNTIFWGALLNASYKAGKNSKVSLKNIYSLTSENLVIHRQGTDYENLQFIDANALKFSSTQFLNSVLSGDHFLPSIKSKIVWHVGYTNVAQSVPDLRRMYYYRNLDASEDDTLMYAYVPFGNASPNYAGKFYSDLDEKTYNGEANFSFPVSFIGKSNQIKFGYFEQYRTRTFDARVLGYVITNPGFFRYNLLTKPVDSLFLPENMGKNGFHIDEITNPSDHYTGSANLHSGYVVIDNSWNEKLRTVWGVRVENFIQKLHSMGYSNDTIEVNANYVDVLPSLNITYYLTEKINLRLAGSRTVARPEFRELAPFGFYDFSTATSVSGNDSLKRTNISNGDFRVEYFPSAGQILSASFFYKDFQNPIETNVESSGAGSRSISFTNAPNAYVKGIELEFRRKLDFLNGFINWSQLENISLFGNISFIKSRVNKSGDLRASEDRPLQGQSPYILNAGLSYYLPNTGTGLNLVFNRIGNRIYQVGNSGYLSIQEAPRNLFDLQLSTRILQKGEIKFSIGDVFQNEGIFYQDQNKNGKFDSEVDSKISQYKYSTTYSLSLSYVF